MINVMKQEGRLNRIGYTEINLYSCSNLLIGNNVKNLPWKKNPLIKD